MVPGSLDNHAGRDRNQGMKGNGVTGEALWSFKFISDIKQPIQWMGAGMENRCKLSSSTKGKTQGASMLSAISNHLVIGNSGLGRATFSISVSIFHPADADVHFSYGWRNLL